MVRNDLLLLNEKTRKVINMSSNRRLIGLIAAFVVVVGTGFPQVASAQLALFNNGTLSGKGPFGTGTIPNVGPPTNWVQLQGAPGDGGFILPPGIFSLMTDFTFAFTGYPYVRAIQSRMASEGNFTKSYFAPNATVTLMKNDALYPNAAPTTPAPGFARMKIGPNGFGGPMVLQRKTTYIQTVSATPGFSKGTFTGTFRYGDGAGGQSAFRNCCGYSVNTNTVTAGQNGAAWLWDPTYAWLTGTITVSAPAGVAASYFTAMGTDSRNAAGTTGTIQMIAPRLTYGYSLPGQVPPKDGTGSIGTITWEAGGIGTASLTFLPEPGSALLLGSGILGLVGIGRLRRRHI